VGTRAPPPTEGQDVNDYRADACRYFKRTYLTPSNKYYKINYRRLVANDQLEAFTNFERQLLPECVKENRNPENIDPGKLKIIPKIDPYTGRTTEVNFVGGLTQLRPGQPWPAEQYSFISDLTRPGRRTTLKQIQSTADTLARQK
jgi:hypothetical protein